MIPTQILLKIPRFDLHATNLAVFDSNISLVVCNLAAAIRCKQLQCQHGSGQVILAEEGDAWILEKLFTTEGGDNSAIVAPRQAQSTDPLRCNGDIVYKARKQ